MYHKFGKSLVVVISGLSLLGLSGYLQAEEAKAGSAEPMAQQSAGQSIPASTGQPQGYYPPNRQSSRPVVWPDQVARNNPPPQPLQQRPQQPPQQRQIRPQQQPQYRPQQRPPQAAQSYGPPRGYYPPSRAQQPAPTGPQQGRYGAYGPQTGPGGYGAPAPGYYPGGYGNYNRPYPYRRSRSNNFMPWSGDWSSDDMFPWSSSGRKKSKMPWQGWGKDSQPWNKDKEWDKMPWNWNMDNNPINNWSGDGRMKDGSKYYEKGRKKKKANVTWD